MTRPTAATLVCIGFVVAAPELAAQNLDGPALFDRECRRCHNGASGSRAPSPEVLRRRTPEAILAALTSGSMRPQGGRLNGAERRTIAEYLTGREPGGDLIGVGQARCTAQVPFTLDDGTGMWTGWSPTVTNTRRQGAAAAGLSAADVPRLTLRWAFGFPDATSAWSQPTVAGGRVFVGSQNGTVYALDARTGCVHWTFTAQGGVRTAPVLGARTPAGHTLFFGDTGANVYAVDAESGIRLWSRTVDRHPFARVTGSPVLHQGRVFVPVSSLEETAASQPGYECCTFRGSLMALDATTGAVLWQTYTVPPAAPLGRSPEGVALYGPAGAGIWSAPTVDVRRNLVYAATGNTYSGKAAAPLSDAIVAIDPASGAIRWSRQLTEGDVFGCRAGSPNCPDKPGPDFDFGSPPMLATLPDGRDLIVVTQKSGWAYGLDPDREGAVIWRYRAGQGSIWGGIQWGAAVDDRAAYLPVSDIRTEAPGGLHAVDVATGARLWYQPPPSPACGTGPGCSAALISAPTLIPGVLFAGSNDGALRAHATRDGSVVWTFDTNRSFTTVNGIHATGGSMQGPGPTVAAGMVFVNAGYGDHMGRLGNVLLAFDAR